VRGSVCFFGVAFADVPLGGFGGEDDADEDGDGPHPLNGEGDAVGPFVGAFEEGSEDAGGDELAEAPAEVLGWVSLI
jgi:hypothetical protein